MAAIAYLEINFMEQFRFPILNCNRLRSTYINDVKPLAKIILLEQITIVPKLS